MNNRKMALHFLVLCGTFLVSNVLVRSQGSDYMGYPYNYDSMKGRVADDRQLQFLRLPGTSEDYKIGPGDVLEIHIVGLKDLSQTLKVSNSGSVSLPYLGTLEVSEKTAVQLEDEISTRLAEENLIKNPEVLVYISEYRAKPIYILGQVDRPGQYIMSQQLTLMDAILLAGGLDFTAGRYGYLHRLITESDNSDNVAPAVISGDGSIGSPQTVVTRIDLQPAKEGGVISPNPAMRRGDTFFIPERKIETFFVVGDVHSAGAFEVPPENELKVSQAISQAGGPTKTAKLGDGLLVRYDKTGSRKEMAVDFGAILRGDQPDILVQANDVIFIPGSNAKTVGFGLLNIVPGIVQSAIIYGPIR